MPLNATMISFGGDRILFDFGPHDSHVNDVWCPSG